MIMKNVRQKLADACKNVEMSRELNEFTSYMATVVNDELNPEGMLLMYACVVDDIRNGKSGFATDYNGKLPQYLIDKKSQVLAQAVYFPQVIDEIAEPEFAERFREGCKGPLILLLLRRLILKLKENILNMLPLQLNGGPKQLQVLNMIMVRI